MRPDPSPATVARRLAALAALDCIETVEAGRWRLRMEPAAVVQRFEELRALDELTRYLHAAREQNERR